MALNNLPIEVCLPIRSHTTSNLLYSSVANDGLAQLNQHIASYLEEDRDICNFRLVCQNTRNAIDGDKFSFWRKRFRDAFDPLLHATNNTTVKETYQHRCKVVKHGVNFRSGRSSPEVEYLKVLRDLVVGG